jgi:hypothetical protein
MDVEGYETIKNALEGALPADIMPQPQEGEDVKFVTIEFSRDVPPATLLNALGAAGLAHRGPSRQMIVNHDPNLSVIGMSPGSVTFVDTNLGR